MDLHVGNPVVRGALTLFPVFNGEAVAERDYVLDAAALTVTERAGVPVVGELVVANPGTAPALVLEGELLEVFDAPATLAQVWDGLVRAAAVDAVGRPAVATSGRRARAFAQAVRRVRLGGDGRGATADVRVAVLRRRGRALHTVAVGPAAVAA